MALAAEEDLPLEENGKHLFSQYGFNSQIAPDRFDLQRIEKKSGETFREYTQRWREMAAQARPPLDEKETIKIFVDTLKNPYFDQMVGLQLQFFPVGERIEDAVKTKKIVDMPALMALVEQIAKRNLMGKNEGVIQMIAKSNREWRRILPCDTYLESAKTDLDSTSSQRAQDLNDLLGLLKGAVFVRGQWRNLRQQHQDR